MKPLRTWQNSWNIILEENEFALPPFSLLVPLSQGKFECSVTDVLQLTDKLEADMPAMLSEHKDITAALIQLKDAATSENKPAGVEFAEHLAAYAQTEEEITYPTALLIGWYVKSKGTEMCSIIFNTPNSPGSSAEDRGDRQARDHPKYA